MDVIVGSHSLNQPPMVEIKGNILHENKVIFPEEYLVHHHGCSFFLLFH